MAGDGPSRASVSRPSASRSSASGPPASPSASASGPSASGPSASGPSASGPSALRASVAHVVVASLDAPLLDAPDAHHLAHVLRLRDGEPVTITDGSGLWRACRFRRPGELLDPDGPVLESPRPHPSLTVGFAPVTGERTDWTVRKLTELGVDRIVPLRTARSVVRWDGERARAAVERLRRVAREAAMQSRRCWLPTVSEVDAPAAFPGAALAEPGGAPPSLTWPTVLVGPEGGWAPEELSVAAATVSLGSLVLRSETAALATAAILGALRSRSVVEASHMG
jgi:16S rRNA (uracil1498-N3)-methyltransferase